MGWATRIGLLLAVDFRSLAAMRIGMGLTILTGLCARFPDVAAHYTDEGVLSRAARMALGTQGNWVEPPYWLSLHMLSGEAWWQWVLLATAVVFAVGLIIGYRTRLALAGSWMLLISLHGRNPLVLQGGDELLRCMMFWSMFVPLGAAWSIDRWYYGLSEKRSVHSLGTAGLILQLCAVYVFTAMLKTHPVWWRDFDAVYYALSCDHFTTSLGYWFLQFPSLLRVLTFGTLGLEFFGPFLLFVPFWTGRIRTILVGAFVGFHFGLAATMQLGLFPFVCMAYWLVLLPSSFWDSWAKIKPVAWFHGTIVDGPTVSRLVESIRKLPKPKAASPEFKIAWRANLLAGVSLIYMLGLNIQRLEGHVYAELKPGPIRWLGDAVQLDQFWCMFAPRPYPFGGWLVIKGTLADGTEVNLLDPQSKIDVPPKLVSAVYPNQRWRKYLVNLIERDSPIHRKSVADYFRRRWNAAHSPGQHVDVVDIVHMTLPTRPPGNDDTSPENVEPWVIAHHDYRLR